MDSVRCVGGAHQLDWAGLSGKDRSFVGKGLEALGLNLLLVITNCWILISAA